MSSEFLVQIDSQIAELESNIAAKQKSIAENRAQANEIIAAYPLEESLRKAGLRPTLDKLDASMFQQSKFLRDDFDAKKQLEQQKEQFVIELQERQAQNEIQAQNFQHQATSDMTVQQQPVREQPVEQTIQRHVAIFDESARGSNFTSSVNSGIGIIAIIAVIAIALLVLARRK